MILLNRFLAFQVFLVLLANLDLLNRDYYQNCVDNWRRFYGEDITMDERKMLGAVLCNHFGFSYDNLCDEVNAEVYLGEIYVSISLSLYRKSREKMYGLLGISSATLAEAIEQFREKSYLAQFPVTEEYEMEIIHNFLGRTRDPRLLKIATNNGNDYIRRIDFFEKMDKSHTGA